MFKLDFDKMQTLQDYKKILVILEVLKLANIYFEETDVPEHIKKYIKEI